MSYCLVWVHGIGEIAPHYSDSWVEVYNPYLNFHIPPDAYVETFWGGVFQSQEEFDEARVRAALETAFFARVTGLMHSQGLAGAWSAFTQWVAQGQVSLPGWVVNQDAYIDKFAKYLVNRKIREEVKDQVKQELRKLADSQSACSVFAHSWGSVVAYESLFDLVSEGSGFQCAHLFTLGSPLWLVHPLLDNKTGRKPDNVSHWVNIHAQGDMIGGALQPGFQVDQEYAVASFGNDPHGSYFIPGNAIVQRDIVADTILGRSSEGPH